MDLAVYLFCFNFAWRSNATLHSAQKSGTSTIGNFLEINTILKWLRRFTPSGALDLPMELENSRVKERGTPHGYEMFSRAVSLMPVNGSKTGRTTLVGGAMPCGNLVNAQFKPS
jgi:hypothetical protein